MGKGLLSSRRYVERLEKIVHEGDLGWDKLAGKTVLITGATGTIGRMLIDVLMYWNKICARDESERAIKVLALGRNEKKARERLGEYFGDKNFEFLEQNICEEISVERKVDFVVQTASSTDPFEFARKPVDAILPNVIGLNNLAKWAAEKGVTRLVFLSSVEVYGENKSQKDKFLEEDLGYIDCNSVRAGYPEAKRLGEALLTAYQKQYGLDYVTLRLARVFGPTMLRDNTKSTSQFIMKALAGEDIVLKTAGAHQFSYVYIADAVRAIIWGLTKAKSGEAYNVADEGIDISLRQFAEGCAEAAGVKVIFEGMTEEEAKVYATSFEKLLMDVRKLREDGLVIEGDFGEMIGETLEVMKDEGI